MVVSPWYDTIAEFNRVRVLGVTISSDLSLDDHVARVSATCFYWLRQFRRVRRSLDDDAIKTLVHAFITSRVDYCNAVLAGSPKSTTDTLQRVLNAAARLVTNTDKYDRGLSSLLHDQLHWPNVPERIEYKLAVMVRRCLEDTAPTYLSDYCIPVTAFSSRHLRSVISINWLYRAVGEIHWIYGLSLWRARRSGTHYRPSFVIWLPVLVTLVFRRTLKTILFAWY